jgi:hypothetical protein
MKYLQGSNISRDESYEDFSYSTKPVAILLAKDLIERLYSPPMNNDSAATIPDFLKSTPTPTTSSLEMELQSSIESVSSVRPTTHPDTFTELQKEIKLFVSTGTRTHKVYFLKITRTNRFKASWWLERYGYGIHNGRPKWCSG